MNNELPRRAEALIECVGHLARLHPSVEGYAKEKKEQRSKFSQLAVGLSAEFKNPRLKQAIRRLMNKVQDAQDLMEEAAAESGSPPYSHRRFLADCNRAGADFLQEVSLIAQSMPDAEASDDSDLHAYDREALEILRKSAKAETVLRATLLAQPICMGFAPLIPLTSFDHSKLKRIGIPFSNFRGYVVLEQQRVLGIGFNAVQNHAATLLRQGDGEEYLAKIKRAKTYESIDNATKAHLESIYEDMISVFFRKYPDLLQVGKPTSWNGARWFWVMKKREYALMRGAAFNDNAFRLERWDFAFPSRAKTLKATTPTR